MRPPDPEFRVISRERGRSLSYGQQGSEAPLVGTDFSRQSGKSDWGGRRGAAVPSGVFSGRIVKVAWKNAICCVWELQIHYISILAAFWYILKGCKIVARKRYQRHVFVQIA